MHKQSTTRQKSQVNHSAAHVSLQLVHMVDHQWSDQQSERLTQWADLCPKHNKAKKVNHAVCCIHSILYAFAAVAELHPACHAVLTWDRSLLVDQVSVDRSLPIPVLNVI